MVLYLPFPVMPISIKAVIGVRRASPSFFFFCALSLQWNSVRERQKSNRAFLTSVQSHSRRFLLFTHIHNWGTLLAASTLAHTASIAALSSRRLAFFSFALLDFLWRHKMNGEEKKAGNIWWITDGSEWHFSPWHRHTKNAKSWDHYRQRGAITLCLFLPLNLFPSLLRMISASHFSPLLYCWIDLLLSKSVTCADEMTR